MLKKIVFFVLLVVLAMAAPALAQNPVDLDGDGQTELEDAVYALQVVSGIRAGSSVTPSPTVTTQIRISWRVDPTAETVETTVSVTGVSAPTSRGSLPSITLMDGLTLIPLRDSNKTFDSSFLRQVEGEYLDFPLSKYRDLRDNLVYNYTNIPKEVLEVELGKALYYIPSFP